MKKISFALAILMLAVSLNVTAMQGNAAESGATENNIYEVIATANLRLSPSVEGKWIATVPEGAVIIRLGEDVSGYSLVDYNDQKGYIYTGCIRIAGEEAAREILESAEAERVSAVEETSTQRMSRSSRDHDEAYSVNSEMTTMTFAAHVDEREGSGERERVRSQVSMIAQTMSGTGVAEASAQTVVTQMNAAGPSETATQRIVQSQETEKIDDLICIHTNLRQTPGTDSDFLASLPRGASVTVLGRSGGYALVEYDGMTGYVLDDFVCNAVDLNRVGSHPVLFTVTAYCPCRICCGNYSPEVTGGVPHTATGTIPQAGRTIAVDPSVIPYGTHVTIEGLGTYIAEDCGGAVKGNHIDLYFDTHAEAVAFGKQWLYVTIR